MASEEIVFFTEAATGGVLRNFAKFKGKHLCQSHFFIKLQARKTRSVWQLKREEKWFDNRQYVGESSL